MKTAIYKNILPALLLCPALLSAQEQLTKEIDVEREIVPELRAASRMEVFPVTVRPDIKPVSLTPGELTSAADFAPLAQRYEPTWGGAAAEATPYRGYVDAGYFPVSDFGVAAGFAAIARRNTTLNIWANLNRRQYQDKLDEDYPDYKTLDVTAAVAFSHRFSPKGALSLATDFGYSSFNHTLLHYDNTGVLADPTQGVTRWNLRGSWDGSADNGLLYTVKLHGGIFNYSKALTGDEDAQRQTTFGAAVGASLPINGQSRFGMDITTDWQHLKVVWVSGNTPSLPWYTESKTFSVSRFTPHYSFRNDKFDIRAGVSLNLITGNGTDIRIAPDVLVAYNPVAQFGAWFKATGGGVLNTLQSLYEVSRYMPPTAVNTASDLTTDSELGLRVGPFKGVVLQGGVAYANAKSWMVPDDERHCANEDLNSFKVFAAITASWRDYVSLTARYDHRLGSGYDRYWYTWRDNTRCALSASLAVRPIQGLEITAGYTGRFKRTYGDISSLSAGATYRITAPLSVFAKFDNILNRTQYDVVGFQTPGFNGLFGVEYKF